MTNSRNENSMDGLYEVFLPHPLKKPAQVVKPFTSSEDISRAITPVSLSSCPGFTMCLVSTCTFLGVVA